MIIFKNGNFIDETNATISIYDRGFLYGDSIFETIRVYNGRPFAWEQHIKRLSDGLGFLKYPTELKKQISLESALHLISINNISNGILKINVSRGISPRGYCIPKTQAPNVIMSTFHPNVIEELYWWRLSISPIKIFSSDPLNQIKTGCKLNQVLAKTEAEEAGFNDALFTNEKGEITETSMANFFWIKNDRIFTPPITGGLLPGITRSIVINICKQNGLLITEKSGNINDISIIDAAFLTSSSLGIIGVDSICGVPLKRHPIISLLYEKYCHLLNQYTQS